MLKFVKSFSNTCSQFNRKVHTFVKIIEIIDFVICVIYESVESIMLYSI